MSQENLSDSLKNAFLQSTISDDEKLAVKAEDIEISSGLNFSEHFFEPQPGNSYLLKFLPNPGGKPIEHRSLYRNLPDPERKGKTFQYVSSGNAKTCQALELFFELNNLKKGGDAVAEKKIENYLSRTNQACAKVQVLQSPKPEEIGIIRMFTFSTFGPNATLANLIDQKLNPTKDMIAQGYEKEDIFNIFGSSVLSVICTESTYEGGRKGRDFGKSSWAPKKRGAIAKLEDGTTHEFSAADLENGQIKAEVSPFFEAFVAEVTNPKYSILEFFSHKEVDDPRVSKETNDYVKSVYKKLDEIIPVIRDKSLQEIAAYGKKDTSSGSGAGEQKTDAAKNILADSLPDELAGSVMGAANTVANTATNAERPGAEKNEVDDILGS